ncbi:hypothetical protein [Nocardioides insulae]|uniref:hypothetical protein n=1 Tax=Nocardioides insulae TaxID=394734 RepID=UPI0004205EB9|nr:hypothetical protein [Nocardioides insulae]
MSQTIADRSAADSWAEFDRTTSRWGRITMLATIVVMLAGPVILAFQVGFEPLATLGSFLAIASVFGILWFVEPLSYFPILGPASMYQAFMIGNISNKLLPSAIVAQSTIDAKPGTRRGQLTAVLAICGAATTHLLGLLVLVGIFGTLLLRVIPDEVTSTVQVYVLPAVMGGAIVQMVFSNLQLRVLIIAVAVGAVVVFVLTPLFPVIGYFAIVLAVVSTVLLALFLPGGNKHQHAEELEAEDLS